VHYAGCVEQRNAWREFASRHGLLLIADAAHAVGVEEAASFGDATAFSFYGNKNMTTAEGGMVVSDRPEILDRVRQMRSHGMTSGTFQRHQSGAPRYDVTMFGYNYRMDELRAALGLVQLGRLAAWNERRRVLVALYAEALAAMCPAILVPRLHGFNSAHHIMPIVLPAEVNRDRVIASLYSDNINTSIHYPPIHEFSFYKSRLPNLHLAKTEEFSRRELTLPLHPAMHDRDVERVVSSLAAALA
jgi:dTDP-4-amino-4,6-dideoxygalactose transaminase